MPFVTASGSEGSVAALVWLPSASSGRIIPGNAGISGAGSVCWDQTWKKSRFSGPVSCLTGN